MSAYVILDIKVFDPLGYEEYKRVGATTIVAYGGKPLARGGGIEVAEGDWNPKRLCSRRARNYNCPGMSKTRLRPRRVCCSKPDNCA